MINNKVRGYGRVKVRTFETTSAEASLFIESLRQPVDSVSGIEPIGRVTIQTSNDARNNYNTIWVWEHPIVAEVSDQELDPMSYAFNVVRLELFDPVYTDIGEDEHGNRIGYLSGFFHCEGMEVPTIGKSGKLHLQDETKVFSERASKHEIDADKFGPLGNQRSCFNSRTGRGCFRGPAACFSASIFPGLGGGCFKNPCFNFPAFRIAWNIFSLIGAIALVIAMFCMFFCSSFGADGQGSDENNEKEKQVVDDVPPVVEGGQSAIRGDLYFNVADHKDVDGDVIDLYINETLIAENVELFLDPIEFSSSAVKENEVNVLRVVPKSAGTGSKEVCTARIELIDECTGMKRPPFLLQMKMGQEGIYYLFVESLECP